MASAGTISFRLEGDTAQFQRSVSNAKRSIGSLKDSLLSIKGAIAAAGITAIGKKFTDLARVQVEAETRLAGAIAATGSAIDASKIAQYAADLQKVTTFGDEASISAAAMLTSFKLTEDQIISLLPKIQDFAAATGKDLNTAAQLFGRLISSGEADLSRYGIALSDTEKELLKTGDSADRAALAVELLDSRFGGMAQQLAKTPFGKYDQAMNNIGDTMEELGTSIMPDVAKSFKTVAGWVQKFVAELKEVSQFYGAISELGLTEGIAFFKREKIEENFKKAAASMALVPLVKSVEEATSKGVKRGLKKGAKDGPQFDFSGVGGADAFAGIKSGAEFQLGAMGAGAAEAARKLTYLANVSEANTKLQQQLADAEKSRLDAITGPAKQTAIAATGKMGGLASAGMRGMEAGGPMGALSDMAAKLITSTQAFQGIIEMFNGVFDSLVTIMEPVVTVVGGIVQTVLAPMQPVLTALGDALSSIFSAISPLIQLLVELNPAMILFKSVLGIFHGVFKVVGAVFRKVGEFIQGIAKGIAKFWNGIVGFIAKVFKKIGSIPGLGRVKKWAKEFKKKHEISIDNWDKTAEESKGVAANIKEANKELSEQMLNVPTGLKVALRRFQSITGEGSGGVDMRQQHQQNFDGGGKTLIVQGNVIIDDGDPAGIWDRIMSAADHSNVAQDGSLAPTSSAANTLPNRAAIRGIAGI